MSEIINGLKAYIETTNDAKSLVQTVVQLHSSSPVLEHAEEVCIAGKDLLLSEY